MERSNRTQTATVEWKYFLLSPARLPVASVSFSDPDAIRESIFSLLSDASPSASQFGFDAPRCCAKQKHKQDGTLLEEAIIRCSFHNGKIISRRKARVENPFRKSGNFRREPHLKINQKSIETGCPNSCVRAVTQNLNTKFHDPE